MLIQVPETTNGWFFGSLPQEGLGDGPFNELRVTLESGFPPDAYQPDDLLGFPLEADFGIDFGIDFGMLGICSLVEDTYGTVSNVHLELFEETVTVESVTWSTVKMLYQ